MRCLAPPLLPALLGLALVMTACGDRDDDAVDPARAPAADASTLPRPIQSGGAVTAMPGRPGPGDVPLGGRAPQPEPDAPDLPPLEDNPETGLLGTQVGLPLDPVTPIAPDPSPEEAAALIRTYYGAINALDHGRAYALWSDGGRASGQSPEQFAAGFAQTSTVMVDVGAPGALQGAAGARTVVVPVSLQAQQADGSIRRYQGHHVLRQAVTDAGSEVQRGWRIASVDLRETGTP